jgi:Gene product 88
MPDQHRQMSVSRARLIALGNNGGRLGEPSKMRGYSFGISAFQCKRGSILADDPTSVCAHCYARNAFYDTKFEVRIAHERRMAGLSHPEWVPAMVTLILAHTDQANPYFRWHDSGDLQGLWHLINIIEVCKATPKVKHWLPTHEPYIVLEYLQGGGTIPVNLCLRISADFIGKPPEKIQGLEGLPTHTAHRGHGKRHRVMVSSRPGDSYECDSYTRAAKEGTAGICGDCHLCWNRQVKNVSFPVHGEKWGKHQLDLFQIQKAP